MEQLKDEGPGDVAGEGEGAAPRIPLLARLRVSKRTMIIAAAGILSLSLVLAGVSAYRASVRQKEAVLAQQKERLEKEEAAKAAVLEQVKEGRRAHEEVMAASPLRSELPAPPAPPVKEPDAVREAANAADTVKAASPAEPASKSTAAAETPKPAAVPAEEKAAPKKAAEVAVPGAAGGCTLSGGRAEDYGKALGRCLEEFNRLEGRKN